MNIRNTVLSLALAPVLATSMMARQAHADTSVGAYVNYDGWSLGTIDAFNTDTARRAAAINIFSSFDFNWWGHLRYQAGNIVSRGGTPLISWMPYKRDRPDANILEEIIDGKHDGYVYAWLDGFKYWLSTYPSDQQPKIALRFAHEFNGIWYPWGDKPDALKAAWRHLHQMFVRKGVGHAVDWVWNANNVDVDSHNDVTRYYPGDDVVDWLSIDGYNWGSNYSFSSWKSFDETFSKMYVKMVENYPGKPIMLAEVSSAEPHDMPNAAKGQDGDDADAYESKDLWISDMMSRIKETYPAIKSIVWFNTNKELSWGLNLDNNTGLAAYNNSVSDDYFSAKLKKPIPTDSQSADDEKPQLAARGLSARAASNEVAPVSKGDKKLTAYAMAMAKKPQVVGLKKLDKEARGIRSMGKKVLRKWRLERILPKEVDSTPFD